MSSGGEVKVEVQTSSSVIEDKLKPEETKDRYNSRYMGKKVSDTRSLFNANKEETKPFKCKTEERNHPRSSSPVQRTNRLTAREITIQRLETGENVTSYKDTKTSHKLNSQTGTIQTASKPEGLRVGNKVKEIKVQRESSPEFRQVKLRKASQQAAATQQNDSNQLSVQQTTETDKRSSRKISPDRFERLKFDFERGVPTENVPRRTSETTDHIELQTKVREQTRPVQDSDTPVIAKKQKEVSILKEGLKVSDFVKQVNRMNPECDGPPKWKLHRQLSEANSSAASSDVGATESSDAFYQDIPAESGDPEDDDDDIYEKVTLRTGECAPSCFADLLSRGFDSIQYVLCLDNEGKMR